LKALFLWLVLGTSCTSFEGPLLTSQLATVADAGADAGTPSRLVAAGAFAPASVADLNAIASRWNQAPTFAGLVLGPVINNAWAIPAVDVSGIAALGPRLKMTPFAGLKKNLVAVSLDVTSVRDENNEDFLKIAANFASVARVARQIGARGIYFDTQTPSQQMFSFAEVGRNRNFAVVQASFKQRGAELMRAMLAEFPEIVVVVSIGFAEVWRSVCIDGVPLTSERYGLLPAFLDGLRDAISATGSGQLIDGFLPSQSVKTGSAFSLFHHAIAFNEAALRNGNTAGATTFRSPRGAGAPEFYAWAILPVWRCNSEGRGVFERVMPHGFSLKMDFGQSTFNTSDFSQNFHSPQTFRDVVRQSLAATDDFVMVSSATVDWWSRPGNTPLPLEYAAALAAP
jgi:hypothetical protein